MNRKNGHGEAQEDGAPDRGHLPRAEAAFHCHAHRRCYLQSTAAEEEATLNHLLARQYFVITSIICMTSNRTHLFTRTNDWHVAHPSKEDPGLAGSLLLKCTLPWSREQSVAVAPHSLPWTTSGESMGLVSLRDPLHAAAHGWGGH